MNRCPTHREAPIGLHVLRHECDKSEYRSAAVENEWPLPSTVTRRDMMAVGTEEGVLPTFDDGVAVLKKQIRFQSSLDWSGAGEDAERVVESPQEDRAIVVVIHRVLCSTACSTQELSEKW